MSKEVTDYNAHVTSKTCQWDEIPKQRVGDLLLLCPVCDQQALHAAEAKG